ncbi:transcriptional regulator [Clostridium sp. CAG:470]|nr:transcriptional regulator [Clostridium sp. CAG:470]
MFNSDSIKIIPARIKQARVSRGYSMADLADRINVSKQIISQYELGIANPINIINNLVNVLDYPLNYFTKEMPKNLIESTTYFRSNKSTSKKLKDAANEKVLIFDEIRQYFEQFVNFPKLNLPEIETKDEYSIYDIEDIAREVRKYWNLGLGPINNIIEVLQENGIIISRIKVRNTKIDAFSKWINAIPYIFLSIEKNCALRSRFDIAHELGHILLHQSITKEDMEEKSNLNRIEKEADMFAGAFLLPAESFSKEVFSSSMQNFIALKRRWKVSIGSMIYRCDDLNLLTENQVIYLKKQMSGKNFWRKEPLDDIIEIETPYLYKQIIDIIQENNIITNEQIIDDIALNPSEIEEYCYLKKGQLNTNIINNKIVSIKKYSDIKFGYN